MVMQRRAFTKFYQDNVERIYRFIYFRTGRNHAIAEDLTSEVFLKALEHFADYDPKISKAAWIYRIAHNRAANYLRDRKPTSDVDEHAKWLPDPQTLGFEGMTSDALELEQWLGKLSPEERELVTLKYLSGYSYTTIGEILDRSPDAAKVATHRAMRKLKTICSDFESKKR